MADKTEKTRGIRYLEEQGVAFTVVSYLYKERGAGRAAAAVGWEEERTIKSLVVEASPRGFFFALVPAHRELSTKKLARLLGVKNVELASPHDAQQLTGYVPGGISPFGAYTRLPALMELSLLEHEQVLINGGHRGVLLALSPWTIQELLQAEVEEIIA
ncbi:MAG: YbaK/EbsC family protein [Myxococcota bacterium]|jgi:Cys-tRNA(Pro) deacylase|nr:YbaK/EbsC family protein [Myxococcota bacterium]